MDAENNKVHIVTGYGVMPVEPIKESKDEFPNEEELKNPIWIIHRTRPEYGHDIPCGVEGICKSYDSAVKFAEKLAKRLDARWGISIQGWNWDE